MNALLQILNVIPTIIAAIKAVESAFPSQGAGVAKLNAVLDMVTGCEQTLSDLRPQLTAVISAIVTMFNTAKVFAK